MGIDVTFRHMESDGKLQEYMRSKAQGLVESFPRVEHVHVILDHEKHRFKAEVVVRAKHHIHVEADETSDQVLFSVDKSFEKAEKQLRRLRDKLVDHKQDMKKVEAERR